MYQKPFRHPAVAAVEVPDDRVEAMVHPEFWIERVGDAGEMEIEWIDENEISNAPIFEDVADFGADKKLVYLQQGAVQLALGQKTNREQHRRDENFDRTAGKS